MSKKRIIYGISVVLTILALFIGGKFLINYYGMVDVTDEGELIQYISDNDNANEISILKTSQSGEFFAILYKFNDSVRLFILEKTIIPNYYRRLGGSHTGQSFGTYNFADSKGALIIVFGDNSVLNASKYSIMNEGITYSEEIKDMDFVLRIFHIPDSNDTGSDFYLYDSNNNQIRFY